MQTVDSTARRQQTVTMNAAQGLMTSNQTSTYFLGGARSQRPWMTGGAQVPSNAQSLPASARVPPKAGPNTSQRIRAPTSNEQQTLSASIISTVGGLTDSPRASF